MRHIRTLSLAAALAAVLGAGEAGAQQVNERQNASATGTVEIELGNGSLRVIGWGRNEVQVTGSVSRSGDRVVLDGTGRHTEVRLEGRRGRGSAANLEVRVPAGSSIEVMTGAAPTTISGVNGAISAESHAGVVTINGNPRNLEVTSQAGAVTFDGQTDRAIITSMAGPVRINGTVRQRAEINAMAGAVEVNGSVGEAEINAVNGAVRVANVTGGRVEITSVSGSVTVAGTRLRGNVESVSGSILVSGSLGGALNVETHAGSVEMRMPGNTGAEVQVTTFNGGLDSDWRLQRDGREWHGRLGRGGPNLSITTFSGSVKLTRR
jgi:DUF4097 and DUF4098 domain-containing protein YvlB